MAEQPEGKCSQSFGKSVLHMVEEAARSGRRQRADSEQFSMWVCKIRGTSIHFSIKLKTAIVAGTCCRTSTAPFVLFCSQLTETGSYFPSRSQSKAAAHLGSSGHQELTFVIRLITELRLHLEGQVMSGWGFASVPVLEEIESILSLQRYSSQPYCLLSPF